MRRLSTMLTLALTLAAFSTDAQAQIDLLQDSGFNLSGGSTITKGFQPDYNGTLDGWSNSNAGGSGGGTNGLLGYNFLFLGSGGAQTDAGDAGNLSLWTASNGGSTTWNGTGPTVNGSSLNYIAGDGVYQSGALTDMVSGLTAGVQYKVQFFYAGAQQSGFTGATTEGWKVALGDTQAASVTKVTNAANYTTTMLPDANHSFTGWTQASFFFTADATTEFLAFLAIGTPSGEPPFSLLSDPVLILPEPGAASLLAVSAGMVMLLRRRRA